MEVILLTSSFFSVESLNVRVKLDGDGFQPFWNAKTSYKILHVVLIPYNLPSWLCIKKEKFMLSTLILCPNGPQFSTDTYLEPLIEELKELWKVGVETYDASTK